MRPSLAPVVVTVLAALLLAGCASTPKNARPAGSSASPARHGGYYQDDGPGDNPPDNLDQLPDATPRVEPYLSGANRPYNVFGKEYVPDTSDRSFTERGIASWYGRKFNGQRTSSGEIYDMYSMTAAHPTLPIPSYARVTNPANGRSVIVRINDRGPFHPGRIIDLSFAAAYRLGYTNVGSTQVELERLLPRDIAAGRYASTTLAQVTPPREVASAPAPVPIPARSPLAAAMPVPSAASAASALPAPSAGQASMLPAAGPVLVATAADLPADLVPASALGRATSEAAVELPVSGHYLQLAAFRARAGAEGFMQHMTEELEPALANRLHINAGDSLYKVQLGPYADRSEAEGAAERLRADLGIAPIFVAPR